MKIVKQSDGTTNLWYGVTSDEHHNKAIDAIMSYVNKFRLGQCCALWDFRNGTSVGSREWFIESGLNVFQNKECDELSSMLHGNKEKYERIYWFVQNNN